MINPGISRDIPKLKAKNPGIKNPGIMSFCLSRDQKIPGWILSENPGSKANRKSRDFGIPRQGHLGTFFHWTTIMSTTFLLFHVWTVKIRGRFWSEKNECTQPLLDCLEHQTKNSTWLSKVQPLHNGWKFFLQEHLLLATQWTPSRNYAVLVK